MPIESSGRSRGNPRLYELIEHTPKEGDSPTIWEWPQLVNFFKVAGQPVPGPWPPHQEPRPDPEAEAVPVAVTEPKPADPAPEEEERVEPAASPAKRRSAGSTGRKAQSKRATSASKKPKTS